MAAATILVSLGSLPAQNLTLLKSWNRASGVNYNDCWGYTAPDGREFAIVGETAGIWIVETTDPRNPVQKAWFTARASTWRDFTNVGPYIYAATESRSGRGFRVIDMTNPDAPNDIGYVQTNTLVTAHNVRSDPESGLLFFVGSNQGVAVYDAKANPTNPPLVATLASPYCHDLCAQHGKGYFSNGRSFHVRIMDLTNVRNGQFNIIGTANTPGGYSHNCWVSEDDKLMVATDEIGRSGVTPHMTVWDISNPASPQKVGDYDNGSSFIAHNAYIIGRTAYMSHYTDGIHVIDLADPTKPSRIGRYDTSTYSGASYNGAWGCFVFTDSGVIYGSDIEAGLFVLQQECGHMNRYGKGTAGSSGVPRARFDGASPRVNASKLRVEVENLEANKPFWVVVSTNTGNGSILGAQINVDIAGGLVLGPFLASAQGTATIPAPVPNSPSLGGNRIYMQVFADKGNGTLSASRGMWAGICN